MACLCTINSKYRIWFHVLLSSHPHMLSGVQVHGSQVQPSQGQSILLQAILVSPSPSAVGLLCCFLVILQICDASVPFHYTPHNKCRQSIVSSLPANRTKTPLVPARLAISLSSIYIIMLTSEQYPLVLGLTLRPLTPAIINQHTQEYPRAVTLRIHL